MESILGCKKPINFTRVERCPSCGGSGAKDDSSLKTCDKCGGSGQVRQVHNTIFGQQITVGPCDKCGGSGKIVTDTCKSCGGKGVVKKNKRFCSLPVKATRPRARGDAAEICFW